MKYINRLLMICALLLCILLSGCGANQTTDNTDKSGDVQTKQEQPTAPEPIVCEYAEAMLSFKEPHGDTYQEKYAWATQYENITYHFASKISEEERNAIVNEFVRLIALAEERFGAFDGEYVISIRQDEYAPWSYDHELYISTQNLETQALTTALAQMLFGHEVNYGLCYAFGAELAQAAGYPVEELTATAEQAFALCKEKREYLDMNYACFIVPYADEATIPMVKALAVDFYSSMTQEARNELMRNYSNALYCEHLNAYLTANGLESYDNSDLEGICFYPSGGKMRVVWEDDYAKFYVFADYEMRYKDTYDGVEVDPTNASYYYFRKMVSDFRREGEMMDDLVGRFETEELRTVKCHVLFENSYNSLISAGAYSMMDGYIRLYSTNAYAHEYVHYVTRDFMSSILQMNESGWRGEAIANFCSMRPGTDDGDVMYEAFADGVTGNERLDMVMSIIEEYRGYPLDGNNPGDLYYFINASTVALDLYSGIDGGGIYACTSFGNYIADLTSEEKALEALYYDKPVDIFGKNWDVLKSEWKVWLESEFAWVHEYMVSE